MPEGVNVRSDRVLVTTDAVGGVWHYSVGLARGMADRGVKTCLAVLGPAPNAAQRAAAAGLELIETGLKLDWTAESPAELEHASAVLRDLAGGCASVHLHAPALVGTKPWPAPVVAVAHSCVATWWRAVRSGPLPEDFRWRTAATAAGLHAADAVIAPTAAHAAALQAEYGPCAIHVVRNGGAPAALPQCQRQRAVLTAGRLWDEGKNIAALDRAAAHLPVRAAGPLAGPNGASAQLAHVQWLGELDKRGMARAYASASVFASMALYEPFGLAVLEAAQAGMRLVLSDIPTFRELWDGVAIFVRSEAELPGALRRALAAGNDGGARDRAARYILDATVDATLAVHRGIAAFV